MVAEKLSRYEHPAARAVRRSDAGNYPSLAFGLLASPAHWREHQDVYERITNKIVEVIEKGEEALRGHWSTACGSGDCG